MRTRPKKRKRDWCSYIDVFLNTPIPTPRWDQRKEREVTERDKRRHQAKESLVFDEAISYCLGCFKPSSYTTSCCTWTSVNWIGCGFDREFPAHRPPLRFCYWMKRRKYDRLFVCEKRKLGWLCQGTYPGIEWWLTEESISFTEESCSLSSSRVRSVSSKVCIHRQ